MGKLLGENNGEHWTHIDMYHLILCLFSTPLKPTKVWISRVISCSMILARGILNNQQSKNIVTNKSKHLFSLYFSGFHFNNIDRK